MLAGDLADFSLADVLQLLSVTGKSGTLRLTTTTATGRVVLVDGRVEDASCDAERVPVARRLLGLGLVAGETLLGLLPDGAELPSDRGLVAALVAGEQLDADRGREVLRDQVVDAVFDLARWDEGTFTFEGAEVALHGPVQLTATVDELLGEAADRLEEWERIAGCTGPGDAVVTIRRPGTPPEAIELDGDAWALLSLVDGRRSVDELVALTGQGAFATRRTLAGLLDLEIVGIAADDGAPIARLLDDHAALSAREAVLGGAVRYVAAEPPPSLTQVPDPEPDLSPAGSVEPPEPPLAVSIATDPPAGPPTDPHLPQQPRTVRTVPAPAIDRSVHESDIDGRIAPLKMRIRRDRVSLDPTIDVAFVEQLLAGVKEL